MTKQEWVSHKIGILIKEGYKKDQAAAIAYSMYGRENKQEGGLTFEQERKSQAPQMPVKRILYGVQTNESKQGLAPGQYTRIDYQNGQQDYLNDTGWDNFRRMNNYRIYMEQQRKAQAPMSSNPVTMMQQGGYYDQFNPYFSQNPGMLNTIDITGIPQEDNVGYIPSFGTQQRAAQNRITNSQRVFNPETGQYEDNYDQDGNAMQNQPQYNDYYKMKLFNPYGGVSTDNALFMAGQGFGSGNGAQAAVGAGLFALKGTRDFLSGFAGAKENERVRKEAFNKLYNQEPTYTYMKEGGKISNAEMLTGHFISDMPNPNVEIEHNEIVQNSQTGQIQKAIGESHENGGIAVNLPHNSKVLSDFTKIGAENAKRFKTEYDISVKASDTFANVMDKINKKIGITKLIEDETKYTKEVEEQLKSQGDETTKNLNMEFLSKELKEIEEEKASKKITQDKAFQEVFEAQEAVPKKGKQGELVKEEGGYTQDVLKFSKKYNLHPDRIMELMQSGGSTQSEQITPEAIFQALQGGADPNQVIEQIIASGIVPEQATAMVQQVMAQLQGEQQQPQMQEGGFSFSTRALPSLAGYETQGTSILDQDTLNNVELLQMFTGNGYGEKMANVEDTIKVHDWYFNTDEKKKAFREAVKKKGAQPEVKAFQEAYNKEIVNRAEKAGLPKDQIENIKNNVGFSDAGVKKVDGLYGAFTSTRPLYNFTKKDGEVKIAEVIPQSIKTPAPNAPVNRQLQKLMLADLPQDFVLPPSTLQPVYKPNVTLGRIEAPKIGVEPNLAAIEAQRQTATDSLAFLPDSQRAALTANMLGTTQQSANQAITQAAIANSQAQTQTDTYNTQVGDKQQLLDAKFNQDYEQKMYAAMNNTERDIRSYFNQNNAINRQNFQDTANLNMLNAMYPNYQTNGADIFYNPTPLNIAPAQGDVELARLYEQYKNDPQKLNELQRMRAAMYKSGQ